MSWSAEISFFSCLWGRPWTRRKGCSESVSRKNDTTLRQSWQEVQQRRASIHPEPRRLLQEEASANTEIRREGEVGDRDECFALVARLFTGEELCQYVCRLRAR